MCSLKWKFKRLIYVFIAFLTIELLFDQNEAIAQSCEQCQIRVLFKGKYTDETCNVVINGGGNAETVILPTLSINSLNHNGNEIGSRQFDVALKDCPTNRLITLKFTSNISTPDPETGNLLNDIGDSNSKNVQIRLRKENGSQMIIDDINSGQDYQIPKSGGEVKHFYTASYYAKGNSSVTAGLVKSTAGIMLVYK